MLKLILLVFCQKVKIFIQLFFCEMDNVKRKTKEEDFTSKKICLDQDINKKVLKKPTLNPEIIYEIFETITRGCGRFLSIEDEEQRKKNIEIFMASGRQPLNVALNFFTRIDSVDIRTNEIRLYNKKVKIGEISYNSLFLKPILNIIGPSINDFSLSHLPEGVNIDDIFEVLVNEDIEYVSSRKILTEKCFSKLCNLTSIQHLSYPFTYSQLSLIRSKCPTFSMPWIKNLHICSDVELSDFTAESVEYFVKCISEIFPNIEELYIQFEPLNPTWKSGYGIKKVLEPNLFESFPLSVKGNIEMELGVEEMESLDDFYKLTEGDNEYVNDIYMALKKFKIHEDFTAYLFIRC
uniref:Uncharacterized protein n=1 Tax=Panagrolaimus sp. PS1159 TaxID=55785 RepID=A0AC35FUY4_9BILA